MILKRAQEDVTIHKQALDVSSGRQAVVHMLVTINYPELACPVSPLPERGFMAFFSLHLFSASSLVSQVFWLHVAFSKNVLTKPNSKYYLSTFPHV